MLKFSLSVNQSASQPITQPKASSSSFAVAKLLPIPTPDISWAAAQHDRFQDYRQCSLGWQRLLMQPQSVPRRHAHKYCSSTAVRFALNLKLTVNKISIERGPFQRESW